LNHSYTLGEGNFLFRIHYHNTWKYTETHLLSMAVIHSVAIVHWRLVCDSADAFICTDDIQSPIHVLLYEQNGRDSCPHNCTTTLRPMLAPAALPYRQLSSNNTQPARASCIKVVKKKEQPLLSLQRTQSEGLHHHPLRVKAIKGKSHIQAMNVHKGVQKYRSTRAISTKYLWALFRTRLTLNCSPLSSIIMLANKWAEWPSTTTVRLDDSFCCQMCTTYFGFLYKPYRAQRLLYVLSQYSKFLHASHKLFISFVRVSG
jgi:hypothetical protein